MWIIENIKITWTKGEAISNNLEGSSTSWGEYQAILIWAGVEEVQQSGKVDVKGLLLIKGITQGPRMHTCISKRNYVGLLWNLKHT